MNEVDNSRAFYMFYGMNETLCRDMNHSLYDLESVYGRLLEHTNLAGTTNLSLPYQGWRSFYVSGWSLTRDPRPYSLHIGMRHLLCIKQEILKLKHGGR